MAVGVIKSVIFDEAVKASKTKAAQKAEKKKK